MRLLNQINEWMARVEGFFLTIFLGSMVFLAFLQVVMRNVFNQGIPWADSVVRLLVLWVGFLGAALASKLEQNITIEVLTKYMPERARHIASVAAKIFAGVVCYLLFRASLVYIGDERTTGEQFLNLVPSWYTILIIPLTFVLIPFHFLFGVVRDVRYFLKGKK